MQKGYCLLEHVLGPGSFIEEYSRSCPHVGDDGTTVSPDTYAKSVRLNFLRARGDREDGDVSDRRDKRGPSMAAMIK